MFLRLYFLLPNEELTQQIIPELLNANVSKNNIHAIIRKQSPNSSLPDSSKWQRMDISQQIENYAWNTNLIVFFLAFISLPVFLFLNMNIPAALCIAIMATSFIIGNAFALLVPKVHLGEFEHALNHGEVLLMVDTSKKHSASIEDLITRNHPAAIAGGSCWNINAMGI